jgi:hypothetical protein
MPTDKFPKQPDEGDRDIIDRELARQDQKQDAGKATDKTGKKDDSRDQTGNDKR